MIDTPHVTESAAQPVARIHLHVSHEEMQRVIGPGISEIMSGLADAWGALMVWVEEQGLQPADDLWEVYQVGPESGGAPSSWRTELNRRLVAR